MRKIDIASALVLMVLSGVVALDTWHLPYWSDFAPGPAFASRWIAAAGLLIGVVLLVQALREASREGAEWPDLTGARQVGLCILMLGLFVALLPFVGTALGSFLFVLGFLLLVARRSITAAVVTSLATTAIIEGAFVVWLGVDLPKGVIGF